MNELPLFGDWLRSRRKALDLTREALAQRVGCSAITIRKLEADERRPSRVMAERLAAELGIPAEQRSAFLAFARTGISESPPAELPAAPVVPSAQSLPPRWSPPRPPTDLIGREADLAQLCAMLLQPRTQLATILGPAGVGKTRLSLEAAAQLQAQFHDGVAFVALAAVSEPALVVDTIARALGLADIASSPQDRLRAALHERHLLLVLDNFEQITPAAGAIADLLAACPRLKVLATSRTPLHIRGERLFGLAPLALPDLTRQSDAAALGAVPSVALFVERVQAFVPQFALSEKNSRAVAAICARLDGLPLAIELVAARCRLLPPPALLERLNGAQSQPSLDFLTHGPLDLPERHRTLRGAMEWSYSLLSPIEQRVFERLAVFVGGWDIGAAEAICGDAEAAGAMLDVLQSLIDNSLVQVVSAPDEIVRCTMLETVREYALERVARSNDWDALRDRHAYYFLTLAETAEPHLITGGQQEWLARLEQEQTNLRAALHRLLTTEQTVAAARLAAALNRFWYLHGHLVEGRRWLEQIVALCPTSDAPADAAVWSKLLFVAGSFAHDQTDLQRAQTYYERSLALRRHAGDRDGETTVLHNLGILAYEQADYAGSQTLFEAVLAHRLAHGDRWGAAGALNNLGVLAAARHDSATAERYYSEGLAIRRELGDIEGIANSLGNLGAIAHDRGDYAVAQTRYAEALALRRELGNVQGVALSLQHLGTVLVAAGDAVRARACLLESLDLHAAFEDRRGIAACLLGLARVALLNNSAQARAAARLLGAAEAIREQAGMAMPPTQVPQWERAVAAAQTALDAVAFAASWAYGRSRTLEAIIADAHRQDV